MLDDPSTTRWRIGTKLEDYHSFLDYNWLDRVRQKLIGTEYEDFFYRLCFTWKGTANSSMLPVMAIQNCKDYNDAFIDAETPKEVRFIKELGNRVMSGVQPSLEPKQEARISYNISQLQGQIYSDYKKYTPRVDEQEMWRKLLKEPEFSMAILISQRMCYANLFFGYEDFLINVLKIITGRESIRTSNRKEFMKVVREALGDEACIKYWTCDSIRIPQLVRHAISHAGGDETDDLAKVNHSIYVYEKRLQITITDTRKLFETLSRTVEQLVYQLIAV